MDPQHLSPEYGLSVIRLATDDDMTAWPALLLHSRSLTWPFDPHARPLNDLADVQGHAAAAGLYVVRDPFGPNLKESPAWTFHLPGARPARLVSGILTIEITRTPNISPAWWSLAVAHGGRCRLLVAPCVAMPADPDRPGYAAQVLIEGAADSRVFGATIAVSFFTPTLEAPAEAR